MKRLLSLVAFFATLQASAQQVNPVPDYVFANRMSAGRNTVTDTAAYFSIGPRYGATRGMMPPMVVDTASFSANKRNGLLIFSVQKNKFLYWDSVGVKWAEMAGTGGSAITGSGVAGYMPEFTTTTNLDTTRLYHSAGRFAIGSTTTTNGVFNVYGGQSYFDTSLLVGANTLFADEGSGFVGIGTKSPLAMLEVVKNQNATTSILVKNTDSTNTSSRASFLLSSGAVNSEFTNISNTGFFSGTTSNHRYHLNTNGTVKVVITEVGRVLIGTTVEGTNTLDVAGSLRTTTGANFATTSGSVGVGTTSPQQSLHANASTGAYLQLSRTAQGGTTSPFGGIYFGDGTTFQEAAILSGADGNVVSGNMAFYTRAAAGSLLEAFRANSTQELLVGGISDQGAYRLQVSGNIYNSGSITTGAPSGGSIKPWKIGEAATVSPTSPNRTLRVEVDGVVYYIHAKTTND